MVQGDEADFGCEVAGCGDKPFVGVDKGDIEDLAERIGHVLAGSSHMRTDHVGSGDHLVLEAGIELHVPRFVDLPGREERGFLLRSVRSDQPRELGRDPLLGDHQRSEREQQRLALLGAEPRPLGVVGVEVDRER